MSEQPDRLHWIELENEVVRIPETVPPAKPAAPDPRIDDYLDHVYAPLVGVVPYAQRQELKAELRTHLETLAASYEELGSTPESAVVSALRQFGDPRDLSREWAKEWRRPAEVVHAQPAWRAMGWALGCFGLVALLTSLMLPAEQTTSALFSGVSPALFISLVGVLPPAVAGFATGLLAPARHALGTFYALAVLILSSAALASSYACALLLAFAQPFFWVPIGCAAAALGGWLQGRISPKPRPWALQ